MLDEFLKPEKAVDELDVRPGDQVADLGCGAGYFTIPVSQRVGSQGRVYAFDVRPEALQATRSKSKLMHQLNVEFSQVNLERDRSTNLRDSSLDKAVASNILFQLENKTGMARETYRILKPGGSLMVIDWSDDKNIGGPPLGHRVDKDEARNIFESAGFTLFKEFSAGSHHYGLIFKK